MLQRRNIHQVTAQQNAAMLFQPLARILKDKMVFLHAVAATEVDGEEGAYNLAVLVAEGCAGMPREWSITSRKSASNLSNTKFIPPKAMIFSFFCDIFAMSVGVLLTFNCTTKVSEISDMAKS